MSRTQLGLYLAITLLGGVFVLVYRGPLWPIIRSYGGDWLVVQALYLVGRLVIGFRWRFHLAAAVFALGLLAEAIQFFSGASISRSLLAELTIGSTFDAGDLIAYGLGLMTVLLIEQRYMRPKPTVSPPI